MRRSIASSSQIETICFNKYASAINHYLENYFSETKLPHCSVEKIFFKKTDAQLYVHKRHAPSISSKHEYHHEDILHDMFLKNDAEKLIFITGAIGCGKSTFIDFFLRCYCSHKLNHDESHLDNLFIHFDFKGVNHIEEFYRRLFDGITFALKINKIHDDFVGVIGKSTDKVERLFKALRELSDQIEHKVLNFKYLTLCFDNIDQSPADIQKAAISLAQELINHANGIKIYKLFFLLWPLTLQSFKLSKLLKKSSSEYSTLDLPHPHLKLLFIKRTNHLLQKIDNHDCPDIKQFIKGINNKIDSTNRKFLFDISCGDLNVMWDLYYRLLESCCITEYKIKYKSDKNYQFIDALLCGDKHIHDRINSLLINPYFVVDQPATSGETLVFGYLLLYFKANHYDYSDTLEFFVNLGFKKALVIKTLDFMAEHHLIHFYLAEGERKEINVHKNAKDAYLKLMSNPAAIDNFAQTTPMDKDFVNGRYPTMEHDPASFKMRVENAVSFINFLKSEESDFFEKFSNLRLAIIRKRIPSIANKVRNSYVKRLKTIRDREASNRSSMTESEAWWIEIFKALEKS